MTKEAKRLAAGLRNFSVSDTVEYATEIVLNARKGAALIESLSEQLEQVTRERDAAVEDLKIHKFCHHCIEGDHESERCYTCDHKCNWQWRGVR